MDDPRPADSPGPTRVVGLRYDPEDGLPQVILKGAGPLAEELLQRRAERGTPAVVHNPTLLEALYRMPIDAGIGVELFRTVAAILVHVVSVDASLARDFQTRREQHG